MLAALAYAARLWCGGSKELMVNLWDGDPAKQARIVNYVRRHHSLLSIYYLEEVSGMRRPARAAIFLVVATFQLALVVALLDTSWPTAVQDVSGGVSSVVLHPRRTSRG